MVRIYLAAFHVRGEGHKLPCAKVAVRAFGSTGTSKWPYDIGDDPSFFCSEKGGGPLTWGICRPDVRNALSPGDIVVFFSVRKIKEIKETEYRFCAVATVCETVPMTDLWLRPALRVFSRYHNLLIEPRSPAFRCWKHSEPILKGKQGHEDWLWRICEHPKGVKKRSFKGRDEFCIDDRIKGHRIIVAPNYIVFSTRRDETYVLPSPPIVARHYKGKGTEVWEKDRISAKVFRLTLGESNRINMSGRFLRIAGGGGHPHRHVKWKVPPNEAREWRTELIEFARKVQNSA